MSRRTLLLAATVGGAAALVVAIAVVVAIMYRDQSAPLGRWQPEQRTAFIESCVKSCRIQPGVTPAKYPLCDQACTCAADEGEKLLSNQELVELYLAEKSGKSSIGDSAKMQKVKDAGIACAARAAGKKN